MDLEAQQSKIFGVKKKNPHIHGSILQKVACPQDKAVIQKPDFVSSNCYTVSNANPEDSNVSYLEYNQRVWLPNLGNDASDTE